MDVPEAMALLPRPGVRAAILDMRFINSGGRSGLDLLRFIRADPLMASLPVIVVTGFVLNRSITAQVEVLDAELWHKPFDVSELGRTVHELVEREAGGHRPE